MKFLITLLVLAISVGVQAAGKSEGIPNRIYHHSNGYTYIRLDTGNNTDQCLNSTSSGSHRISRGDTEYDQKISLIMMALAANRVVTLIDDDANSDTSSIWCSIDSIQVN